MLLPDGTMSTDEAADWEPVNRPWTAEERAEWERETAWQAWVEEQQDAEIEREHALERDPPVFWGWDWEGQDYYDPALAERWMERNR